MANARSVLHVDVNSAFLSWTALDMLEKGHKEDIRTVPSVIGGDEKSRHGIVLAKSYPARAFGIQTGESLFEARRKCPSLLVVPSHYPIYTRHSNILYEMLTDYSPVIQRYSIDECFLEYTGMEHIWGPPAACAERIRARCESELGFTVNVGVGPNKLLAKMAGELKKPNAVCTIFSNELEEKLWPQPVRNLFMVGRMTEQALARRGVKTIGDLARMDPETVKYHLKSHGMMVWSYANGLDPTPVIPNEQVPPKSFSNAATLASNAETAQQAHAALLPLCESVLTRMRRRNFAARLVSVQVKYADFTVSQHQQILPQPTQDSRAVYALACKLFDQLWSGAPVRLIGVRLAELTEPTMEQLTLNDAAEQQARASLDKVTDQIRKRYGRKSLIPAAMLKSDFKSLDRYDPESGKPRTNSPF